MTSSTRGPTGEKRNPIPTSPIRCTCSADAEYNQFEVEAENMGDALNYLDDGMACEVVFWRWPRDFG